MLKKRKNELTQQMLRRYSAHYNAAMRHNIIPLTRVQFEKRKL